jgi:hypothetical protein
MLGGLSLIQVSPSDAGKYRDELNGFRYRTERGGTIAAKTPAGEEVTYASWWEFRKAAGELRSITGDVAKSDSVVVIAYEGNQPQAQQRFEADARTNGYQGLFSHSAELEAG